MPKIEVEITRTRTIEEFLHIEVDVPQRVLNNGKLYEWIEKNTNWQNLDGEVTNEPEVELNYIEQLDD